MALLVATAVVVGGVAAIAFMAALNQLAGSSR
jgi:hypothetical protein